MARKTAAVIALLPSSLLSVDADGAGRGESRLVTGEIITGSKNDGKDDDVRYYLVEDGSGGGDGEEDGVRPAVLELQSWKARNTSWLFTSSSCEKTKVEGADCDRKPGAHENYLEQDGSLFMFTPVDPLFAFLPALDAAKADGFQPLEQIADLTSGENGQSPRMHSALRRAARCACDVKCAGGAEYYRLNDVKVVSWLECKLRKLISHFKAHGEEAVRSLDDDVLMLYCINIMGEWVAPEWTAWLKTLHKLEDPAVAKLVDAAATKMDEEFRATDRAAKPAKPEKTGQQKMEEGRLKSKLEKNAKAAKGTKSIMSFFSKK